MISVTVRVGLVSMARSRVRCRVGLLGGPTVRHLSLNMCGMICLTLLPVASRSRRGRLESRQQIGETTEIVVSEMGAPCANDRGGIRGDDIGPPQRQPGEFPDIVVEIDAILTPRLPAVDPSEGPPLEWMEGMRDAKRLSLIARRWCSRRLTPMSIANG